MLVHSLRCCLRFISFRYNNTPFIHSHTVCIYQQARRQASKQSKKQCKHWIRQSLHGPATQNRSALCLFQFPQGSKKCNLKRPFLLKRSCSSKNEKSSCAQLYGKWSCKSHSSNYRGLSAIFKRTFIQRESAT